MDEESDDGSEEESAVGEESTFDEEALFFSDDVDEVLDLELGESITCRDIELCSFVNETVKDAASRSRLSSAAAPADYKIARAKVFQHLRDLLDGKYGPNESIKTKLEQLRMQERMHKAFVAGKIQKCLLSHYLLHSRTQRLTSISQLEKALELGLPVKWPAVRLAKLPPGMEGLGDRGFAGTSPSYPHCSPMKTPCFLEGRDQFTYAETIGSKDLCQGRYGSEAYNKRTNDYKFLQDKVPRNNFEHFEYVLKWAIFGTNLCQPFLMPRGAGDYFPQDTPHLQKPHKRARAQLSILSQPVPGRHSPTSTTEELTARPTNYIEIAMPERYYEIGLQNVALLMDGKDCVTDTVRVNSFVSRAQYSDKMHCSAGRYIMWVLPCGLSVTYTPLFLGRVSEKALVEYWGGSTYDLLHV